MPMAGSAAADAGTATAAAALLARAGLGGRETVRAERLSHGEHRQLEIAIALSTGPRLLATITSPISRRIPG